MSKAVLSNKIYLNTDVPGAVKHIKDTLTYHIPQPFAQRPLVMRTWAKVGSQVIALPKARTDLIPHDAEIVDKRIKDIIRLPDPKVTLRDSQQKVYDEIEGSSIICAKPGWGKTFTALCIAHKFSMKTLVVVHTKALAEQWQGEVRKVFGFGAGLIGDGVKNYAPPIVIGLVRSVDNMRKDLRDKFGLIIIDECHHCPASTFLRTLSAMKNSVTIGLSATPKRRDGKHVVLPDYFGTKMFYPTVENTLTPKITVVDLPMNIPGGVGDAWAERINQLAENDGYRGYVSAVVEAEKRKGRKVMVLSDRTVFLEEMSAQDPDSVCIVGSTSDRRGELDKIKNGDKKVLYGAITIFKEGVSENYFDSLVLAAPISNEYTLEQVIGRVIRTYKDKSSAHVVDLAFNCSTGRNQLAKRKAYYTKEGWAWKQVSV